jgi:hypothetical protein
MKHFLILKPIATTITSTCFIFFVVGCLQFTSFFVSVCGNSKYSYSAICTRSELYKKVKDNMQNILEGRPLTDGSNTVSTNVTAGNESFGHSKCLHAKHS